VRRGLARSRGEARDLIDEGLVAVDGRPVSKASFLVTGSDAVTVTSDRPRWVGRAAHKLVAALDEWGVQGLTVMGRRCVDVGASTGGFSQVLLARGAAEVVAVDVGHGQLVPEVADDPRVDERSGTTVRGLRADDLGGPADLVVADLSFISLTLVMGDLAGLLRRGGDLVVLVKPQFEVGRSRLNRQGVVSDPTGRTRALEGVVKAVTEHGLHVHGIATSPLRGTSGNTEYLLWARSVPSDTMNPDQVADAVRATTTHPSSGGRR
jgi:23S rRNA (cytidine1920-2'-O)/16S rRNA (cytidine1409-2'-O)-methyltransferase